MNIDDHKRGRCHDAEEESFHWTSYLIGSAGRVEEWLRKNLKMFFLNLVCWLTQNYRVAG
jgi:hypothetical protein